MESRPARDELIEQARSALRAGDAASARILLDEANTEHSDDADVLEGLGRAAYLDLDFQAAIEHWQRAYAGLFSGIWAYSPTPRAVRRSRSPSTSRSTTTCPPWKRKTLSTSPSERPLDIERQINMLRHWRTRLMARSVWPPCAKPLWERDELRKSSTPTKALSLPAGHG